METIKKFSVAALAVVMSICFIPAAAFADTTTSVSTATELQTAIDNGTGSVSLTANITGNVTVGDGESITIDMNGHSITGDSGSDSVVTVENGGTFDTTDGGSIIASADDTAAVFNSGTATLDDGITLKRSDNGGTYYVIVNHGTMTIGTEDDGDSAIVTTNEEVSSMIENGYTNYSSGSAASGYVSGSNSEYPTLTINDGTFTGGLDNVKNDDGGYLTIKGGTFSGPTNENILNFNIAKILGGEYDISTDDMSNINNNRLSSSADVDAGILVVSGGTFNADPAITSTSTLSGAGYGYITVTGGTFAGDVYYSASPRDQSGITVDTDSIAQASTISSLNAALKKALTPSKTSLKLYKGKSKFTAKWYKITDTTGYELKYSTSKKFTSKSTHIKYIKTYKTTKITFNKYVKSKKTYYVKIRTYKQYNGKKYYSGWSSVKSVKTK